MRLTLCLILFSFSANLHSQEDQRFLACLEEAYGDSINLYQHLHLLEKSLLSKGLIQDTTTDDYLEMVNQLKAGEITLKPRDLQVSQYLSRVPYLDCISGFSPADKTDRTTKYVILSGMYIEVAAMTFQINITVHNDGKIGVNGNITPLDELEKVLSAESKTLMKSGVGPEELSVFLSVEPEVKMGLIVDIQTAMRNVQIRKINYHAPEVKE